jgi:hypothetical protein
VFAAGGDGRLVGMDGGGGVMYGLRSHCTGCMGAPLIPVTK